MPSVSVTTNQYERATTTAARLTHRTWLQLAFPHSLSFPQSSSIASISRFPVQLTASSLCWPTRSVTTTIQRQERVNNRVPNVRQRQGRRNVAWPSVYVFAADEYETLFKSIHPLLPVVLTSILQQATSKICVTTGQAVRLVLGLLPHTSTPGRADHPPDSPTRLLPRHYHTLPSRMLPPMSKLAPLPPPNAPPIVEPPPV